MANMLIERALRHTALPFIRLAFNKNFTTPLTDTLSISPLNKYFYGHQQSYEGGTTMTDTGCSSTPSISVSDIKKKVKTHQTGKQGYDLLRCESAQNDRQVPTMPQSVSHTRTFSCHLGQQLEWSRYLNISEDGLDHSRRTFLRARSQTVYKFPRNSFACPLKF